MSYLDRTIRPKRPAGEPNIQPQPQAATPSAAAPAGDHPRTYSLVGTPHLFLVTDDESGINIGYAKKIGGPLVAPSLTATPQPEPDPDNPTHTDDEYIEYGINQYRRGRAQAEYEFAHAPQPEPAGLDWRDRIDAMSDEEFEAYGKWLDVQVREKVARLQRSSGEGQP